MKYADLHVHTFYSDSTSSPEEVVSLAATRAVSAIAICDHDCIDGIEPSQRAGSAQGVEVIAGIELSVEKQDAEIHILGYFIDWKQDWFQKRLKEIQSFRVDRMRRMVEKLNRMDIGLEADDVFKLAGKGSIGRAHLAQALLRGGWVKNLREAFDKYIGFLKPCYLPSVKFSPPEAIGIILKTGGVPVLAHPRLMGKDEYIPELVSYGLKGLEVYHTDHGPGVVKHYEELAAKYALLMTGGSDCHGLNKARVMLGEVRVPYNLVMKLREESEKIRRENQG